MNSQNQPDRIKIYFIYQCIENIPIETDINNKFETVINELSSRKNIDKSSIFFIYNGISLNPVDFDKSISYIISLNDRQIKKMNILVYNINLISEKDVQQSDYVNIMLIVDSVNIFILKGKKAETLKTIIENGNSEIKLELNQCEFIYRNKKINLYEKFDDVADQYDKKINRLAIEANYREKLVVKFTGDEFGEKRVLCFPQDIIGNIIKYKCFAEITQIISQYDKDIHSLYFFKYKNKEIKFGKTFSELFNDNKNEAKDATLITDISVNNITSKNITPNENKEIEINIIKKTYFQRYKILIISIIIFVSAVVIFFIVSLILAAASVHFIFNPK